jgi:hypothetical protein
VVSFGTYGLLQWLLPGGAEPRSVAFFVSYNIAELTRLHFRTPVVLAFVVPLATAVVGYRSADRFARASLVFGCLLWVPLFLITKFPEVRAQMAILVLTLPAALYGIRAVLKAEISPRPLPRA